MSHRSQRPLKSDHKDRNPSKAKSEQTSTPSKGSTKKDKVNSSVSSSIKNPKYRSGSLTRQESIKPRESPKKAQSVDRSQASKRSHLTQGVKRQASEERSEKSKTVTSKKTSSQNVNRSEKKPVDKKPSRNAETTKSKNEKPRKERTNLEIAKSFVKNQTESLYETKSQGNAKSSKSKKHEEKEKVIRPRTSTIRKGPPVVGDVQSTGDSAVKNDAFLKAENTNVHSGKKSPDGDVSSYEDDFEEYDSDFEESESSSVSEAEYSSERSEEDSIVLDPVKNENKVKNSIPPQIETTPIKQDNEIKKNVEKTFLKMSDRSSLNNQKNVNQTSLNSSQMKPSRSIINFASAVEQEEKKKFTNKVLKRSTELLEIITLDVVSYELTDIPPMKYDVYIRTFGSSNAKQVSVQTENYDDEEIQTDDIYKLDKWTQIPPNDSLGYGGDNIQTKVNNSENWKSLFSSHAMRLSKFLQNISVVVLAILEEDYPIFNEQKFTKSRPGMFYSDGYYTLHLLPFLKNSPAVSLCCSESSQYVLSVHDNMTKLPSDNNFTDERGLICLWKLSCYERPEKILIANSQPTCCTFGITHDVIIAGMVDGAVMLWDLTELFSKHTTLIDNEQVELWSPIYNTAAVLGEDNHSSCIVAIQVVNSNERTSKKLSGLGNTASTRNFHLITLEDMGVLNIWVAVEVLKPDMSGLESDLGLAPGGKLRLVKSSTLLLHTLNTLQSELITGIRTFDFRLVPSDSNRILVTTDVGIIHVSRHSGSAEPRYYSGHSESATEIHCIDFSPHNENLFLVGCSDGSARLYDIKSARPLMVFHQVAEGEPVALIQWCSVQPTAFCVLSSTSSFYMWDLRWSIVNSQKSYSFKDSKVTWFTMCCPKDPFVPSDAPLKLLISKENGEIEVHAYQQKMTKEEYQGQVNFMKKL